MVDKLRNTIGLHVSNFFWKNNAGNKFKARIPASNCQLYYTLEEYQGDIDSIHSKHIEGR